MKTGRTILVLVLGVLFMAAGNVMARDAEQNKAATEYAARDSGSAAGQSVLFRGQDDGACLDEGECNAGACCDEVCGDDVCCEELDCCGYQCGPRWRVFGDFMYLRPRNSEVTYGVPINGEITSEGTPVQVGRIAIVDPDYHPTFRVGAERTISDCSSIGLSYTQLYTDDFDSITVEPQVGVLRSMVNHSQNASSDWEDGEAQSHINYKLADVDFRRVFLCGPRHRVSYLAGVRYGHLEQDFHALFSVLGTETVDCDVNFDGGGIRLGLEGERQARCSGLLVYGRTNASFMAGQFRGSYFDSGEGLDPTIVTTQWKAGRLVPTLDLELGAGWATPSGCLRVTAGYMVSAWYNVVNTSDFIGAVQNNDFGGLHDTLTFDGLVIRSELRY